MWSNVYQTIEQTQQKQNMPFDPINNLPQVNRMMMNKMNMNMNQLNERVKMQLMSNFFNQNFSQMNMGGNNNFNNMNNNFNNFNMNNNNFNNMNNNNNNSPSKFNLCFSTLRGERINMTFNCDETIDGVLTKKS